MQVKQSSAIVEREQNIFMKNVYTNIVCNNESFSFIEFCANVTRKSATPRHVDWDCSFCTLRMKCFGSSREGKYAGTRQRKAKKMCKFILVLCNTSVSILHRIDVVHVTALVFACFEFSRTFAMRRHRSQPNRNKSKSECVKHKKNHSLFIPVVLFELQIMLTIIS